MVTSDPSPALPAMDALRAEVDRLGLALPTGALERFARYLLLLEAWNDRAGLKIGRAHV